MLKPIKKSIWRVLDAMGLSGHIIIHANSALTVHGWFRTYAKKESINKKGEPIPWLTYSFLHFIEPRLHNGLSLFEYGSGSSTSWFAQRVGRVVSVESNKLWYEKVKKQLPTDTQLHYVAADQYADFIQSCEGTFDLILIDGIHRVECARACVNKLSERGVILFDNTDIASWQEGIQFLTGRGFRHLPFRSMAPGVSLENTTSVFYRPDNCLGI